MPGEEGASVVVVGTTATLRRMEGIRSGGNRSGVDIAVRKIKGLRDDEVRISWT
jgi:hypothetical protein